MQPIDARVKSQFRMLMTGTAIVILSACGGTGNLSPVPDTGQATSVDTSIPTSPVPLPVDIEGPIACDSNPTRIHARALRLLNQARATGRMCGSTFMPAAAELSWNSKLEVTAASHSADMAGNNFFSHTGSDGSGVGQRADVADYNWRAIGENIAAGQNTIADAIDGWLASAGHCTNIMTADFNHTALACVADSRSDYGNYWTNVFGAQSQ